MTGKERRRQNSKLDFKLMSLIYKLRDFLLPRMEILKEAGIEEGFYVLDFGCGPGSYVMPLVRLVGDAGKVYTLDKNPFAIKAVEALAAKKGLPNVQTILSDCDTGLPSESIDAVLLYDVLHHLGARDKVLMELHRVLKHHGVLSVSDHHLKRDDIIRMVTEGGLFKLSIEGKRTCRFLRKETC
jgi:ubiquinone/menaquinone biosynthesis C-methylase UbiE